MFHFFSKNFSWVGVQWQIMRYLIAIMQLPLWRVHASRSRSLHIAVGSAMFAPLAVCISCLYSSEAQEPCQVSSLLLRIQPMIVWAEVRPLLEHIKMWLEIGQKLPPSVRFTYCDLAHCVSQTMRYSSAYSCADTRVSDQESALFPVDKKGVGCTTEWYFSTFWTSYIFLGEHYRDSRQFATSNTYKHLTFQSNSD